MSFSIYSLVLVFFIKLLNLVSLFVQKTGSKTTSFNYKKVPYYLMTNFQCNGLESTLLECDHAGWGPHKCLSKKPVYLRCEKSPMLRGDQIDIATIQVNITTSISCQTIHTGIICIKCICTDGGLASRLPSCLVCGQSKRPGH